MVVTALGIFSGTDTDNDGIGDTFNAATTFSRGSAATLLAKAYTTPATWEKTQGAYVSTFTDTGTQGQYPATGAGWAYAYGFMSGTNAGGTQFSPDRKITQLEYAGMLVKMLGYHLTDNYKTDIARFANEVGLFSGIDNINLTELITYEQAAKITVNALLAQPVYNDRDKYTTSVDVYEPRPNYAPLLSSNPTLGIQGIKYRATYSQIDDVADPYPLNARDAFGYPGTALTYTNGYIAGFVPHYTVIGKGTKGLTASYIYSAGPTGYFRPDGTAYDFQDQYFNNGTSGTYPWNTTTYADEAVRGTYGELVTYTDYQGKTKYRLVEVYETTDNITNGTTTTQLTYDISVEPKASKTTFPANSLVSRVTKGASVISAKVVTPVVASVLSYTTADGYQNTATLSIDGKTVSAVAISTINISDVHFVSDKITVYVGDHGDIQWQKNVKDSTWSAATADYLYVPETAIAAGGYLGVAHTVDNSFDVVLDSGKVVTQIKIAKAGTTVNGNGITNVANNIYDKFFEYVIQSDGSYALFVPYLSTAYAPNLAIASATAKSYTVVDPAFTNANPTAKVGAVNVSQVKNNSGFALNNAILGSNTTTEIKSVYINTDTTSGAYNPANLSGPIGTYTTVGYQNLVFPVVVGASIRVLTAIDNPYEMAAAGTAKKLFSVHLGTTALTATGSNVVGWTSSLLPAKYATTVAKVTNANGVYSIYSNAFGSSIDYPAYDVLVGTTTASTVGGETPAVGQYAVFNETDYWLATKEMFDVSVISATINATTDQALSLGSPASGYYRAKDTNAILPDNFYVTVAGFEKLSGNAIYTNGNGLKNYIDNLGKTADAAVSAAFEQAFYVTFMPEGPAKVAASAAASNAIASASAGQVSARAAAITEAKRLVPTVAAKPALYAEIVDTTAGKTDATQKTAIEALVKDVFGVTTINGALDDWLVDWVYPTWSGSAVYTTAPFDTEANFQAYVVTQLEAALNAYVGTGGVAGKASATDIATFIKTLIA